MLLEDNGQILEEILKGHIDGAASAWLEEKINLIIDRSSAKDLYLTFSLIPSKIDANKNLNLSSGNSQLKNYLIAQEATIQQITRVYLLHKVLETNREFFAEKVAKLIEVADKSELEAFLKFLILLPNPEDYKNTAVEALRTNISTVFNALAYHNPYPSRFFDDQQWNQMYLKTAFMQGDVSAILDVDKKANKDLARIISDYAHERWAAGRDIDPYFWRPISKFIDEALLKDIERLLHSDDNMENRAGVLCCYHSSHEKAKSLLNDYPELLQQIENENLSWETLKEG